MIILVAQLPRVHQWYLVLLTPRWMLLIWVIRWGNGSSESLFLFHISLHFPYMICPRLNTVQVLSQPPTDWEALRTALGEDFHEKASEDPQQKMDGIWDIVRPLRISLNSNYAKGKWEFRPGKNILAPPARRPPHCRHSPWRFKHMHLLLLLDCADTMHTCSMIYSRDVLEDLTMNICISISISVHVCYIYIVVVYIYIYACMLHKYIHQELPIKSCPSAFNLRNCDQQKTWTLSSNHLKSFTCFP